MLLVTLDEPIQSILNLSPVSIANDSVRFDPGRVKATHVVAVGADLHLPEISSVGVVAGSPPIGVGLPRARAPVCFGVASADGGRREDGRGHEERCGELHCSLSDGRYRVVVDWKSSE